MFGKPFVDALWMNLSLKLCDSKQMQHSRLFSSTKSSGVTMTVGSVRIALSLAGGGALELGLGGSPPKASGLKLGELANIWANMCSIPGGT